VTCTGGRSQFDFFTNTFRHGELLLDFAAGAKVRQNCFNAVLINRTQCSVSNSQTNPAILAFNPKTAVLQIGHEAALGLVIRVRDAIANHGSLAGDLTHSCHR
jgi:hypothetical protein